jgi:hypothetical protein
MKDFRPNNLRFSEGLKKSWIYRSAGKAYHHGLLGTKTRFEYRTFYFIQRFDRNTTRRTVLFYPDKPTYSHVLYKVCNILGCAITSSTRSHPDLVVAFEDITKRRDSPILNEIAADRYVVNKYCDDISKMKVEEVFAEVFGYGTFVDPETYQGLCVIKSNENARHDGEVVQCPSGGTRSDVVYQKLINNAVGDEVLDVRVPIVGGKIPFVYLKHRSLSSRFSNVNARVTIRSTDSVFTNNEETKILKFAEKMGLDCGELDVLRDLDDGKIYIVDVNSTPDGPPNHLSKAEGKQAIQILSSSFNEEFFKRAT